MRVLTWTEIETMVEKIAQSVMAAEVYRPEDEPLEFVYGQPRGGLVPAIMLSHRLGLPLGMSLDTDTCGLWVDDIYDTGQTVHQYSGRSELELACLVSKQDDPPVNHLAEVVTPNEWVVFPWENDSSTYLNNNSLPTYPNQTERV